MRISGAVSTHNDVVKYVPDLPLAWVASLIPESLKEDPDPASACMHVRNASPNANENQREGFCINLAGMATLELRAWQLEIG